MDDQFNTSLHKFQEIDDKYHALSNTQERLMKEMNAYLSAIGDSPGADDATCCSTETKKIANSDDDGLLSAGLKVPPSSTASSNSSSGSGASAINEKIYAASSTKQVSNKQGRRNLSAIDENGGQSNNTEEYVYYNDSMQIPADVGNQFDDDSLVAMARKMDAASIISDPSLIVGPKEKILSLPANITKKLGRRKSVSKESHQKQQHEPCLIPSPNSLMRENKNGYRATGNLQPNHGDNSSDSDSQLNQDSLLVQRERRRSSKNSSTRERGRRSSRRRSGKKKGISRDDIEEGNSSKVRSKSRHRSSSSTRNKKKGGRRKRSKPKRDNNDGSDEESMRGIGFNTRVHHHGKPQDMNNAQRTTDDYEAPRNRSGDESRSRSRPRNKEETNAHKNQTNLDAHVSSDNDDVYSAYNSDEQTQIFYESTDEFTSSEEEDLVAVGTSVADAVKDLNNRRWGLFGLRG